MDWKYLITLLDIFYSCESDMPWETYILIEKKSCFYLAI